MKRLLQLTAIVAILAGIGCTVLILKLNTVVTAMKPQIEEAATTAMGSPVTFNAVSVRLLPTVHLVASGIAIGTNASEAIGVETLETEVPLLPLFRGVLEITTLSVGSPSITVIQSKGKTEIQGLPQGNPKPESHPAAATDVPKKNNPLPITLKLKSFKLTHGNVRVVDATSHQERHISDINVSGGISIVGNDLAIPKAHITATADGTQSLAFDVTNLSLAINSLTASLEKAVVSAPGVEVTLGAKAVNAQAMQGEITIGGSGIDLHEASQPIPALQQYKLGGHIAPDLTYTLSKTQPFHAKGSCTLRDIGATLPSGVLEQLKGTLTLTPKGSPVDGNTLKTDDLSLLLNGEAVSVSLHGEVGFADQAIRVPDAKIAIAGGVLEASGSLKEKKSFSSSAMASNLSIPRLIKAGGLKLPIGITGTIAKLTSTVRGSLGPTLLTSLEGPATLELGESSLTGVNLVREVLAKVDSIPFIEGALIQHVPENFREFLDSRDTPIKRVDAGLSLKEGTATITKLFLESTLFSLEGNGAYRLTDGNVDLNTTIRFSEAFSAALAEKSNGLKNLLDTQGQLTFPLSIMGTPPKVVILPNVAKLMELRAGKVLEKKALGLLSKVLGKDKSDSDSQQTHPSEPPQSLSKGLKGLLGGL